MVIIYDFKQLERLSNDRNPHIPNFYLKVFLPLNGWTKYICNYFRCGLPMIKLYLVILLNHLKTDINPINSFKRCFNAVLPVCKA